ncbi:MAG: endolytic transglycosylase MltG, partial [Bacteroidota bacterium]|nr:endolytic transglycosylase MltG [Bacteroidota bacterium]
MKKNRKYFLYIFLFLILVAVYLAWNLFGPTVNAPDEKYFYIKTGSDYTSVKDSLINKKIISSTLWFDKVARHLNYNESVKPGKYKIDEGMSVVNLVRMLRAGKQSPVNLIITKLRTKEDLAKKIGNNFECDSVSVSNFLNNNDSLVKYNVDTNTVMTAVIPNTYTLTWNNTPGKIFKKFYAEEQKFWNEKRKDEAANLHLSEKQIYILASIVEEETNKENDKGKIASVYINRMRNG